MPLVEDIFDQERIDTIRDILQQDAESGRKKDFEILIDGFKVVNRTNSVERFEDYERHVKPNTRNISILVYDGPGTPRNTRYSFNLQSTPAPGANTRTLGEIEEIVAQKLEERERQHQLTKLRDELKETLEQLAEEEDRSERLEREIEEMKQRRYAHSVSLGELAGVILKGIVRTHAAKIPGGQALAGLLGADLPDEIPPPVNPSEETPVSFERTEPALDEMTRNRISLIAQLQERFSPDQMIAVFSILDNLAVRPDRVTATLDFLTQQ